MRDLFRLPFLILGLCAVAHAQQGPSDVLIEKLREGDVHERRRAARDLGRRGTPEAIPALVEALEDVPVRSWAAEALGQFGPAARDAVPALAKLLTARGQVRVYAAEALGRIGPAAAQAVPALALGLKSDEAELRRTVASALGRIGPGAEASRPALSARLEDEDVAVRVAAALALYRIDAREQAVTFLASCLGEQEDRHRTAAAEALAMIGPAARGALPKLKVSLSDPSGAVRVDVARAIHRIAPEAEVAIPALVAEFETEAASDAESALIEIGTSAIPVLIEAMDSPNADVRSSAISALGWMGRKAERAIPHLVATLPDHRVETSMALDRIGAPAIPVLIEALDDPNAGVRSGAALSLYIMGPKASPAVQALTAALQDEDCEVRWWAGSALRRIRGR